MAYDDWGFFLGVAAGVVDTIYFETSFIESMSASIILTSIAYYYDNKADQTLEFARQTESLQKAWEEESKVWLLKGKQALKSISSTFNSEYVKNRYAKLADSLSGADLAQPIICSANPSLNFRLLLELGSITSEVRKGKFNEFPAILDAWKDFEKSGEKLEHLRRQKESSRERDNAYRSRFLMSHFLYMFSVPYLFLVGIFTVLAMIFF